MKHLIVLLALITLALPAKAEVPQYPVFAIISTWTVGGTGTKAFAFQNTSSDFSVRILKIDIKPISGAAVTSGPMNFWVMTSTKVTHGGLTQVSFASLGAPNISTQPFIAASTGPVNVQYEGKTNGTSQLPVYVIPANPDETATNFSGMDNAVYSNAWNNAQDIVLPKGANRAIVLEQKQFGASDFTAGVVLTTVYYTLW